MPSSLDLLPPTQAGAARAALVRARLVVAAAYYFFGYWFSHRRA